MDEKGAKVLARDDLTLNFHTGTAQPSCCLRQ